MAWSGTLRSLTRNRLNDKSSANIPVRLSVMNPRKRRTDAAWHSAIMDATKGEVSYYDEALYDLSRYSTPR